jgi:hypothetical protein
MKNCVCGHTRRRHIGRIVNTYFCREMGCKCDNYKEAAKGDKSIGCCATLSPKGKVMTPVVGTHNKPRKSLKCINCNKPVEIGSRYENLCIECDDNSFE